MLCFSHFRYQTSYALGISLLLYDQLRAMRPNLTAWSYDLLGLLDTGDQEEHFAHHVTPGFSHRGF